MLGNVENEQKARRIMETRKIVCFEDKHGKRTHRIIRCMPHDPKPVVGQKFGKFGLVVIVQPIEEN